MERFQASLTQTSSHVALLAMPFMGLLLYLSFRGQSAIGNGDMVGAMVVSLHLHAFGYLVLSAVSMAVWVGFPGWIQWVAVLAIGIYLFVSLLRSDQAMVGWTAMKAMLVFALHLSFVVGLTLSVSVYSLSLL